MPCRRPEPWPKRISVDTTTATPPVDTDTCDLAILDRLYARRIAMGATDRELASEPLYQLRNARHSARARGLACDQQAAAEIAAEAAERTRPSTLRVVCSTTVRRLDDVLIIRESGSRGDLPIGTLKDSTGRRTEYVGGSLAGGKWSALVYVPRAAWDAGLRAQVMARTDAATGIATIPVPPLGSQIAFACEDLLALDLRAVLATHPRLVENGLQWGLGFYGDERLLHRAITGLDERDVFAAAVRKQLDAIGGVDRKAAAEFWKRADVITATPAALAQAGE